MQVLEVFRVGPDRGWGLRARTSVPAGRFVCEYAGEVLTDADGDKRGKEKGDEYLLDMDLTYMKRLEAGQLGGGGGGGGGEAEAGAKAEAKAEPGAAGPGGAELPAEELCIDAKQKGNIGRFLNHCCDPNLAIQNVLVGHSDLRLPRSPYFPAPILPQSSQHTLPTRIF